MVQRKAHGVSGKLKSLAPVATVKVVFETRFSQLELECVSAQAHITACTNMCMSTCLLAIVWERGDESESSFSDERNSINKRSEI